MHLYLVQHGDALSKDLDPGRPLSDKGLADIGRLADWLGERGVKVKEILHSGKTRARQTAELLGSVVESGGRIREESGLGPNDSPRAFLEALRDREGDILVVGHMPFVARAVSAAVTGEPDRPLVESVPGSIAGLTRDDGRAWCLFLFARPGFY